MYVALDKAGAQLRDTANRAMTGIPKGRLPKNVRGGNHHLAAAVSQEHSHASWSLEARFPSLPQAAWVTSARKKKRKQLGGVLGFRQKKIGS